ncbi:AfsR/SARP family transcriptional regulator [Streptomyces sp. NPDC050560]|uniref:AfsR/SARP family transcriptional regulator n=1 Tax=Streptomyces sp. NPDC050560 TaxID=3365630 RepID=UPI00378D2B5A
MVEFEIRLSGPVTVHTADGGAHTPASTKTRLAFAVLAWEAGRPVSVDKLVLRVWADAPPAKPRDAMHAHMSRIRAMLRRLGADAPALTSGSSSYTLGVDPDRVDLRRYVALVDRARALAESRDEPGALRLLREAEPFAAEEPLAGINADWADHLRTVVGEKRLAAGAVHSGILLGSGRFTEAIALLTALAEDFPADEALVERLALALHGSGRTAEAAQLLYGTLQRLSGEGLHRNGRLRRIQQGILTGVPATALLQQTDDARPQGGATATARQPPRPPATTVVDNLPRDIPWVGREEELRHLTGALTEDTPGGTTDRVAVEAIDGMGGVGKTALAIHAAHMLRDRFPDGRIFLPRRAHALESAPLSTTRALTDLLRLVDGPTRLPENEEELVALWRSTVRDRRMLIILDDAAGADQVRPLLPGASPTAVVITSRRRLTGLPGARLISLDILPPADAIALFNRKFDARRAARSLRDEDTAQLVRLGDLLPIAVEILASRLLAHPSWHTSHLLRQVRDEDRRLSEMRDGERTLTGVFSLSYRDLTPVQQLVFRRVALHFGSEFDPHAAAALANVPVDQAEHTLEDLLSWSLLREPSPSRFTAHDLLRAYARGIPEPDDSADGASGNGQGAESRRALERLVDHYVSAASRADRLAYPYRVRISGPVSSTGGSWPGFGDASAAEQWFLLERRNLLGVLEWLENNSTSQRLSTAVHVLAGFLEADGHFPTAAPLLHRAVAHWRGTGRAAEQGRALLDLSSACTGAGRYGEAQAAARESLALARSLEDVRLECEALHRLALIFWFTARYAEGLPLLERSLRLSSEAGDGLNIARSQNLLGVVHHHLDHQETAVKYFRLAYTGATAVGDIRGRYMVLNNISERHQKMGNHAEAERTLREAIQLAEVLGKKGEMATLTMNLANTMTVLGRAAEALDLYEKALPELRAVGDVRGEALSLNSMGVALRHLGRSEEALPRHAVALGMVRRLQAAGDEVTTLIDMALAELETGRTASAERRLQLAAGIAARIGARTDEARARARLAELDGVGHFDGDR